MASSEKRVIYVPARFNIRTIDGDPSASLPAVRAMLEAETLAGSRIWIDDPQCYMNLGTQRVFRQFLREHDVPHYAIGGGSDPEITHVMIEGVLFARLDK